METSFEPRMKCLDAVRTVKELQQELGTLQFFHFLKV